MLIVVVPDNHQLKIFQQAADHCIPIEWKRLWELLLLDIFKYHLDEQFLNSV